MGPPTRNLQWTAVAYGHPRKDIVDALLGPNGVQGTQRASKSIMAMVATRGASKKPAKNNQFTSIKIDKDIYATGWDGIVVITASSTATYRIDTEGAPH